MKSKLIYIAIPVILLVGLMFGIVIGAGVHTENKGESFEHLQTLAYKAMRNKCHSDGRAENCDRLLIHDAYGNLNGESNTSDGYVFNFSDNYNNDSATLAYRVTILSNAKVTEVKQLNPSEISDTPSS